MLKKLRSLIDMSYTVVQKEMIMLFVLETYAVIKIKRSDKN